MRHFQLFRAGPTRSQTRADTAPRDNECGSIMIVVMLLMVSVGAMVTSHLTMIVAEQKKIELRYHAQRARSQAVGELERAKNIVNSASYAGGVNSVLRQAITANPPLIPGTQVEVVRVGAASPWFRLRSTGSAQGVTKSAQIFVRDTSPSSSYNLYVDSHPVGISGQPRGDIHSNETIQFYFPWGRYTDAVTATKGFGYKAGADPSNTTLLGAYNANAAKKAMLAGKKVSDLADQAKTLRVTDNLVGEVEFKGKKTEVRLYAPSYKYQVKMTGYKKVFSHYLKVPYKVQIKRYNTVRYYVDEPVYKTQVYYTTEKYKVYKYVYVPVTKKQKIYQTKRVSYTVKTPIYGTRQVQTTEKYKVWVPAPPPPRGSVSGGFSVAGGGSGSSSLGKYVWKTRTVTKTQKYVVRYKTETKYKNQSVFVGYKTVTSTQKTKVFSHYNTYQKKRTKQVKVGTKRVAKYKSVFSHYDYETRYSYQPQYKSVPYTYYETRTMPERIARTHLVDTKGIIYLAGEVRSISGKVNGQLTLASSKTAKITDSITYVDDDGRSRMNNGLDPTKPYEANPDYDGNAVLGVMTDGDIIYSRHSPQKIEVNASMLSINGKVAFDGIRVSSDGKTVSHGRERGTRSRDYIKDSMRRLGGIVTKYRPVASYVDSRNRVVAGFSRGVALMDRNLMMEGGGAAPPGAFQEQKPVWAMMSVGKYYSAK